MNQIAEAYPISYYIKNKDQVIDNLLLKLVELKGRRYTCCDTELPYINQEIKNVEKVIKFNKKLKV